MQIPKEVKKKIAMMRKAGKSNAEIIASTGVSKTSIWRITKTYEIKTERKHKAESNSKLIRNLARRGKSVIEIARQCGLSATAISNYCSKHSITLADWRKKRHFTQSALDDDIAIIKELAKTMTAAVLADKWEIDIKTMRNWLYTRGIRAAKAKPTGRPKKAPNK